MLDKKSLNIFWSIFEASIFLQIFLAFSKSFWYFRKWAYKKNKYSYDFISETPNILNNSIYSNGVLAKLALVSAGYLVKAIFVICSYELFIYNLTRSSAS